MNWLLAQHVERSWCLVNVYTLCKCGDWNMMETCPLPTPIHTPWLKPAKRHLTTISSSFPSLGPHAPSEPVESRRTIWAKRLMSLCSWWETYPRASPYSCGLGFPLAMSLNMRVWLEEGQQSWATGTFSFHSFKKISIGLRLVFKKWFLHSSLTMHI